MNTAQLSKQTKIHQDIIDDILERLQIDFGIFQDIEWNKKTGYPLTELEASFLTSLLSPPKYTVTPI